MIKYGLCVILVLCLGCAREDRSNKKRVSIVSGGIVDRSWETNNVQYLDTGMIRFYDSDGKYVILSSNYILEEL